MNHRIYYSKKERVTIIIYKVDLNPFFLNNHFKRLKFQAWFSLRIFQRSDCILISRNTCLPLLNNTCFIFSQPSLTNKTSKLSLWTSFHSVRLSHLSSWIIYLSVMPFFLLMLTSLVGTDTRWHWRHGLSLLYHLMKISFMTDVLIHKQLRNLIRKVFFLLYHWMFVDE